MSMIMAEARGLPLAGTRTLHFSAHRIAVDAADVLRLAHGEADLLALEAAVRDRHLVQRAREHLEALLEAQRVLAEAPATAHFRRRVVEMRRAPVAALAGGGLGGVGAPIRDGKAVHDEAGAGLELALELRRQPPQVVRQ